MKKSNKYVFDIEVFPNYFCIVLKKLNDDKILIIDSDNFNRQKKLLYGVISKNVCSKTPEEAEEPGTSSAVGGRGDDVTMA